jgi:AcrR family transcriptional regulator
MSNDIYPSTDQDPSYIPREKGLLRRDKILDAATQVFCHNGYEAANLQEIMSMAGGSLATLYRLFGNKEGLFQAVIERNSQQMITKLASPLMQSKDPIEVLHTLGHSFLEILSSPMVGAIHRLLISEAGRNPKLREIFVKMAPERNLRAVADYLQTLVNSGYLQLEDSYMAAQQLLSMFKGNYHMRCVLGETVVISEQEKKQYVESAVGIFLNGCAK